MADRGRITEAISNSIRHSGATTIVAERMSAQRPGDEARPFAEAMAEREDRVVIRCPLCDIHLAPTAPGP